MRELAGSTGTTLLLPRAMRATKQGLIDTSFLVVVVLMARGNSKVVPYHSVLGWARMSKRGQRESD